MLTALLVMLPQLGNEPQRILYISILDGLGVDPSQVHDQYNQLLAVRRDPTLHTQSILNTAQEIAKYIEMINNQAGNVRLYHRQLPKERIDGVAFQPSTKLLRIEE